MVWSILYFQGSYVNVHLTLKYFLVLKTYWKIVSGTLRFDCYFPLQGFYQLFIKGSCFFFLFQKPLSSLNHGQYGLFYIFHLESINKFLSKAHIGNSEQDKIQFEPYCPFKDSTYVSIKTSFLLLKIFLKNFNQGQYGLIHIVI